MLTCRDAEANVEAADSADRFRFRLRIPGCKRGFAVERGTVHHQEKAIHGYQFTAQAENESNSFNEKTPSVH